MTATNQTGPPLIVVHEPLTLRDVPQELIDQLNYPYIRFYRTDIINNTDRSLKIIWFDSFFEFNGFWSSSNIKNRVLRNDDFLDWYSRDDMDPEGWLRPGGVASCMVNWHWSETPEDINIKWAFIGIDDQGNDYFGEAMVPKIKPEKFK